MLPKNYSSELYHYGVKGMRWGVRKDQSSDSGLSSADKRRIKRKLRSRYTPSYEQNKVIVEMNSTAKRGVSDRAWEKAFKAGKDSKEWKEYEQVTKEWLDEYQYEMAGAALRDMKHEDTAAGREFVRQLMHK